MIPIDEARKCLPVCYEELGDDEIQELVEYFYKVVYLFVDNYLEE